MTAHRVCSSTLVGALRAWVTETATHVIHTPPGGRGHPGQIHRRCVVRCYTERAARVCPSGETRRQAPRFPTIILAALEDSVVSLDTPTYWRVMSRWLLLQCWATLPFDDHRGTVPSELKISGSGLLGKLTRSKVSGPDKKPNFRLLVVHSTAYVHHKLWLVTVWQLLEKEAPYSRDYLLPAPSNNHKGFKNKELKYQAPFAVQSRILAFSSYRGQKIIGRTLGTITRPTTGGTSCPRPRLSSISPAHPQRS